MLSLDSYIDGERAGRRLGSPQPSKSATAQGARPGPGGGTSRPAGCPLAPVAGFPRPWPEGERGAMAERAPLGRSAAGERIQGADLVGWVTLGMQHVTRSEDIPLIANVQTYFLIKVRDPKPCFQIKVRGQCRMPVCRGGGRPEGAAQWASWPGGSAGWRHSGAEASGVPRLREGRRCPHDRLHGQHRRPAPPLLLQPFNYFDRLASLNAAADDPSCAADALSTVLGNATQPFG